MGFRSKQRPPFVGQFPARIQSLRWHRLFSLVILIAFLPSCFNWREMGPTPETALKETTPSRVRITRTDGSKLTLDDPAVLGDSIVGRSAAAPRGGMTPRVAVPTAEVAKLAIPRFNGLKTAGLVLGTAALAVLVACMAEDCAYIFHEDPS